MKLQFKEQQYQLDAINSIVNVFSGCSISQKDMDFYKNPRIWNYENENLIKDNIYNVQKHNNIPKQYHTTRITNNAYARNTIANFDESLFLDITMETGTGKTFTFIETMYKLNAENGLSKFIVLVPSIAIKQGTIKNLDITKEYFQQKYNNKKLDVFAYSSAPSKKGKGVPTIPAIENFISNSNNNISVLIMTRQAFASKNNTDESKSNIIYRKRESTLYNNSRTYMDAIASQNPDLIIDEPHRFKTDKSIELLKNFNAQFVLRYGATFGEKGKENYKNLMYILDSINAFKYNLVKRIEVTTIENEDIINSQIQLLSSSTKDRADIECFTKDGKTIRVSLLKNDNLSEKTKDNRFDGYILENIASIDGKKIAFFSNGFSLQENVIDSISRQKEAEKEILLKTTIDYHFEKERVLFDKGIKVLSLIFIDGVRQYRGTKGDAGIGELAQLFEKLYKNRLEDELENMLTSESYKKHLLELKKDISQVHAGYFSEDNQISDDKIENDIEIVLNDKEKLLDIKEPRRFIFSMWALQEGWDNPNVFNLCKLAPSNSSVTKLQQIGRGLRLAVNKYGERITAEYDDFDQINMLSVIVPSTEKNFVLDIQHDIAQGNIHNTTYILTAEILKNKDIVTSDKKAYSLITELENLQIIVEDIANEDQFIIQENLDISLIDRINENIITEQQKELLKRHLLSINSLKSKIKNKTKSNNPVKINKENYKKFQELWEYLNQKVYYEFNIDTSQLIKQVQEKIEIQKRDIQNGKDINVFKLQKDIVNRDTEIGKTITSIQKSSIKYDRKYTVKEVINIIQKQTKISIHTIISILKGMDIEVFNQLCTNTKHTRDYIIDFIKQSKMDMILQKISYNFLDENVSNTILTKNGQVVDSIDISCLGRNSIDKFLKDTCLYSNIIGYDSDIEYDTIQESTHNSITVYAKLPKIKIPLPFGTFSPDFAYVINQGDNKFLYLVVETKGYYTLYDNHLSEIEKQKIEFTKKFIQSLQTLQKKNVPIYYHTKINQQEISTIIHNILEK